MKPTTVDRTTLMNTGAATERRSGQYKFYTVNASATILPDWSFLGKHEFKVGYYFGRYSSNYFVAARAYGSYTLVTDNGKAYQFVALNSPVDPTDWDDSTSAYIADRWNVGQRLTLNLGLRWDRQHSFIPEQSREAGEWPFVPAETFPHTEVIKYSHVAPRLAAAFDVTGRGKTVLKAAYGWFNPQTPLANSFNTNSAYTTTFLWRDLNANLNYDPGEVNLSLNGPDYVSSTSAKYAMVNPDLKLAAVQEFATSIEHEVATGMSVRGLYLRRIDRNRSAAVTYLRPYDVYSAAYSRKDPGPDGATGTSDDGGFVTLYDYPAQYRPAAFGENQTRNAPGSISNNYVQAFEFSFTKRQGSLWLATFSFTANNSHAYTWAQNPNQATFFPTSSIWTWNSKVNGNINLPYDISVGGIIEVFSGPQGQRTYIFRAADPLGGPSFKGQTSITVPLEEAGSRKEPSYAIVNARFGKLFRFGGRHNVRLSLDFLNLFNSNAVLGVSYASGPTFNDVTNAQTPRNFRVGVSYSF